MVLLFPLGCFQSLQEDSNRALCLRWSVRVTRFQSLQEDSNRDTLAGIATIGNSFQSLQEDSNPQAQHRRAPRRHVSNPYRKILILAAPGWRRQYLRVSNPYRKILIIGGLQAAAAAPPGFQS